MNANQMNNAILIKCPCCGSTAQVRAGDPYVVEGGAYFEQKAVCGCGASFTASFPRVVTAYYDVFEGEEE